MTVSEQSTVDAVELPGAGTYRFGPEHSTLEFSGKHIFTTARGRFGSFEGTIEVGDGPQDSSVELSIDAGSLQSSSQMRDDHLRSPDFLNVEGFPRIAFRSKALRPTGGRAFELDGELTIKDITRPVTLTGEYLGSAVDPFGNTSIGFTAATSFDRADFEMTWNMALEAGGWLVGKTVTVEVQVEAQRQAASSQAA